MKRILLAFGLSLISYLGMAQQCIGNGTATITYKSTAAGVCTYDIAMSVTTTQNAAKIVRFEINNATPAVSPVCKINSSTIIACDATNLNNIGNNVTITHTFTNVSFPCNTSPAIVISGSTSSNAFQNLCTPPIVITITNANPVKISYFKGIASADGITLNWQTETETNSSYFAVQRSNNAQEFSDLAIIKSSGESLSKIDYQYTDTKPLSGINYYRLRQVDNDGSQTFSKIIDIKSEGGSSETVIFPNPSDGEFLLQSNEDIISLDAYSISGKKIEVKLEKKDHQYLLTFINKPDIGSYLLQVKTTSGITKYRLMVNQ